MSSETWIAIAAGYAIQNDLLNENFNMSGLIAAAAISTFVLIFAIFVKADKKDKKK